MAIFLPSHTHLTEEYDAYIVVSFTNATLVLSIGETVEEVTDSGFLGTTPTLACSRLGDDALIQVHTFSCGCVFAAWDHGLVHASLSRLTALWEAGCGW